MKPIKNLPSVYCQASSYPALLCVFVGAFHVEMQRASQKDKLFNCLYHPIEPGMYTINVHWSGHHVQGSPFRVFVASNEMELLEYETQTAR